MVELKKIRVGSEVVVRGDFGSGKPIHAIVDEVEEDIKNGMAGIDYHPKNDSSDGHWAYLTQVDRVVKY